MKDFVTRVIAEKNELGERIEKLNKFLKTDTFSELSEFEQIALQDQLGVMKIYFGILCTRIGYYS